MESSSPTKALARAYVKFHQANEAYSNFLAECATKQTFNKADLSLLAEAAYRAEINLYAAYVRYMNNPEYDES